MICINLLGKVKTEKLYKQAFLTEAVDLHLS